MKMKMKNNRVLCTIKLSGHNQLLHHLHHRTSVKCEKFGSETTVCFHLSHGCASAPAADGRRHWFLDPPFKNTISEKCNEGFSFLLGRWNDLAASSWWPRRLVLRNVLWRANVSTLEGANFILQVHVSLQSDISKVHQRNYTPTQARPGSVLEVTTWVPFDPAFVKISIYRLTSDRQTALDNGWSNLSPVSTATQTTRQH